MAQAERVTIGASFGALPPDSTNRRMVDVSREIEGGVAGLVNTFGEAVVASIFDTGITYRYAGIGRKMITKGKTDAEIQAHFEAWEPGVTSRGTKSREDLVSDARRILKRIHPNYTDEQLDEILAEEG